MTWVAVWLIDETMLAVTATVSDSTAGIRLEEAK